MTEQFNIPKYNKMSNDKINFFNNMAEYVDKPLYFYGSILRRDYIDGKSDIDIAILTDNESSTKTKLQHFLGVDKRDFNKVVWKLGDKMLYGYKIKCNKFKNIDCEVGIYNIEFKDILIKEYSKFIDWGPMVYIMLYILKIFHYILPLLTTKDYAYYKRKIMNSKTTSEFFVLKPSYTNNLKG